MSLGFRTVLFSPLVPDGSGAESVARGIAYRWRAVKPWDAGVAAGAMETQWTQWLTVDGTAQTADLPITPAGNGLDVEIQTRIGTDTGRPETRMETVAIPAGSGTIDYYNTVSGEGAVLVRLNRSTLTAIPAPPSDTVQAQIDALTAAIAAISGGATNLAGITDMSPFMRTVNDDTTAAAALATLTAAPLASPGFTGNPTAPTPTAGDADTSIATTAYVAAAVTGATSFNNVVLTGTVTVPDGAFAIADTAGLQAALDARLPTAPGSGVYDVLAWVPSSPTDARPSADTTTLYLIDLPGDVAPANGAAWDLWLRS